MASRKNLQHQPKSGIKLHFPARVARAVARERLGRERTRRQQLRWMNAELVEMGRELQEIVDERRRRIVKREPGASAKVVIKQEDDN